MTQLTREQIEELMGDPHPPSDDVRAACHMALRTHDAEQRAEKAEAERDSLRDDFAREFARSCRLAYEKDEALATPPEGEPVQMEEAQTPAGTTYYHATMPYPDAPQQPEDAPPEDALVALIDRVAPALDELSSLEETQYPAEAALYHDRNRIRRDLRDELPALASAPYVPEEVRRLPKSWRSNPAEDLPVDSKEQRAYKNACDDCATELEHVLAAAPTKGGASND